ncbi:MAG: DUF2207 domain-containing protein, partial [Propionibacteriaceae bacterium]|nr:DUF2207 domain-containing protein [Propionibacteriaceae bacterium]
MRRTVRRVALAVVVAVAFVLGFAAPAHAADTYDRFDVDYTVTPDGVLQVTETIELRFGPDAGRRGYERYLVTREPFDDDQDMSYEVSNIQVTSPDPVSTATQVTTRASTDRSSTLRIRIGDPNRRIQAPTATYVISYEVRGALRTPESTNLPELYWDVTGSTMGAIRSSTVTATVPGGVQDATCFMGPPRTSVECSDVSVAGDTVTFSEPDGIPTGSLMTIGVQMDPAAVTNATPIVSERGDAAERRGTMLMQGAGAAAAVGIPVAGWIYYRRRGHDERYAGVPPGMVPAAGEPTRVVRNDPSDPVPVSFTPPKLPLTYAGFLLHGAYRTEHLTATLVGLATHGAIRLGSEPGPTAELLDPRRAPDDPSQLLLDDLFERTNHPVRLDRAGQLADASDALEADARKVAMGKGWFRGVARGRKSSSAMGILWMLMIGAWFFDVRMLAGFAWLLIPATASLVITLIVVQTKMARGQRTARGRAWTDQVEGFRTYIATAEADQLRFEEGEDIFSKYLPWAVLFGLADRWVSVCEKAIAMGRIARPDTSWSGSPVFDAHLMHWHLTSLDRAIPTSSSPSVASHGPSFSSDIGFGGGGSAFGGGGVGGGGGFSGGGGGGGGG